MNTHFSLGLPNSVDFFFKTQTSVFNAALLFVPLFSLASLHETDQEMVLRK